MERIKMMEINGKTYEVFGQYWETRYSWGHNAYLLIDGCEVARDKVRYYNRTWESYRFQSAGQCAVGRYLDSLKQRALDRYREATGRVRLSLDLKKKIWEQDAEVRAVGMVYAAL